MVVFFLREHGGRGGDGEELLRELQGRLLERERQLDQTRLEANKEHSTMSAKSGALSRRRRRSRSRSPSDAPVAAKKVVPKPQPASRRSRVVLFCLACHALRALVAKALAIG